MASPTEERQAARRDNPLKRLWRWFWRPASASRWGAVFLFGGVAGIVFWGGFNTFMEYTNTMSFCVSCHEMRQKRGGKVLNG